MLRLQHQKDTLTPGSSQPEVFNVLGQLHTLERVRKSGELLPKGKEKKKALEVSEDEENEGLVIENEDASKSERSSYPEWKRRYHLVVLAKNTIGYKNLVKLTTISHLKGMRGRGIFSRACIDKELLAKYSEGLIISTACLGGEIPQAILRGRFDVAKEVASWYKDLFGEDFYLEIQDHGSIEDRIVNVAISRIANELDIELSLIHI